MIILAMLLSTCATNKAMIATGPIIREAAYSTIKDYPDDHFAFYYCIACLQEYRNTQTFYNHIQSHTDIEKSPLYKERQMRFHQDSCLGKEVITKSARYKITLYNKCFFYQCRECYFVTSMKGECDMHFNWKHVPLSKDPRMSINFLLNT